MATNRIRNTKHSISRLSCESAMCHVEVEYLKLNTWLINFGLISCPLPFTVKVSIQIYKRFGHKRICTILYLLLYLFASIFMRPFHIFSCQLLKLPLWQFKVSEMKTLKLCNNHSHALSLQDLIIRSLLPFYT